MKNLFPFLSIIGLNVFSLLLLYILWRSTGLVSAEHVDTFALISQVGFILGVAVIGFYEFRQSQKTFEELFLPSMMLISALSVMLILSVFSWRVEAYGIALFVFASLIYAFSRKTLYALNPIYYAVFLYALLRLFGTLFTSKGFHFPDNTIAYYLLPLSFCLFRLSKSTLLKVLRLFVRSIFLFLSVSIVFWFFNFLYLNETISNWFFNKLSFDSLAASDITLHWIHYRQPSYISLVILSALTSGAYLYYKKEEKSCISLPELLSLVVLSLVYILSMESRVGLVGWLFVVILSLIYRLKIYNRKFKTILLVGFLISVCLAFIFRNKITYITTDPARNVCYTLAIGHIKENLWWGCGTNEQQQALLLQAEKTANIMERPGYLPFEHAHNQILCDMLEFGIPGLLVFLILMSALTYYAVKNRSFLLQTFLMTYFLFMMIEGILSVQEGLIRFMIFLSFFIAISEAEEEKAELSFHLR